MSYFLAIIDPTLVVMNPAWENSEEEYKNIKLLGYTLVQHKRELERLKIDVATSREFLENVRISFPWNKKNKDYRDLQTVIFSFFQRSICKFDAPAILLISISPQEFIPSYISPSLKLAWLNLLQNSSKCYNPEVSKSAVASWKRPDFHSESLEISYNTEIFNILIFLNASRWEQLRGIDIYVSKAAFEKTKQKNYQKYLDKMKDEQYRIDNEHKYQLHNYSGDLNCLKPGNVSERIFYYKSDDGAIYVCELLTHDEYLLKLTSKEFNKNQYKEFIKLAES